MNWRTIRGLPFIGRMLTATFRLTRENFLLWRFSQPVCQLITIYETKKMGKKRVVFAHDGTPVP